jgi:hypothetical protein
MKANTLKKTIVVHDWPPHPLYWQLRETSLNWISDFVCCFYHDQVLKPQLPLLQKQLDTNNTSAKTKPPTKAIRFSATVHCKIRQLHQPFHNKLSTADRVALPASWTVMLATEKTLSAMVKSLLATWTTQSATEIVIFANGTITPATEAAVLAKRNNSARHRNC